MHMLLQEIPNGTEQRCPAKSGDCFSFDGVTLSFNGGVTVLR